MPVPQASSAAAGGRAWLEPLLGLSTGALGGAIQGKLLSAPMSQGILLGGIFGLAFSRFFARRASTPGAGLIWGLGGALLLWFVMATGIDVLFLRSASAVIMLNAVQARFPRLVAYLVCLGMPVGVVLGIRGGLRLKGSRPFAGAGRSWREALPEPSVAWRSAVGNMQEGTCRCLRGCRRSPLRLGR